MDMYMSIYPPIHLSVHHIPRYLSIYLYKLKRRTWLKGLNTGQRVINCFIRITHTNQQHTNTYTVLQNVQSMFLIYLYC